MLDLDRQTSEAEPAWAEEGRVAEVRAGVLYTGLELEQLRPLLADLAVERLYAAIGPALFFGRDDGPFVPYDPATRDENEDRAVGERAHPWSLGDVLWLAGTWRGAPTAVRLSRLEGDDCDLFCGSSRVELEDLIRAVRRRAQRTTQHVVRLPATAWAERMDLAAAAAGLLERHRAGLRPRSRVDRVLEYFNRRRF